jgi:CheY-like chemotaxis protein
MVTASSQEGAFVYAEADCRPVAVLDDDVQFIRMVERMLRSRNIPVQPVTTPDLDDAVSVIAGSRCRAALIDIYVYGAAAGFPIIELLRQEPLTRGLPLVVSSGAYRDIARHIPFLQEHHCSVLPKPFTMDELFTRLWEGERATASRTTPEYSEELLELVKHHRHQRFTLAPSTRRDRAD